MIEIAPDRRDYEERDSAQEAWLQRRPVCVCCGEHIQDESAHLIGGDYYCDRCLDDTTIERWKKWKVRYCRRTR